MINSSQHANLQMLTFIAEKLGALCNEVVFLGGCTTGLFVTESIAPDVRYTLDVITLNQYYQFERKLNDCGFKKTMDEEVLCRWTCEGVILDVMPTDEKILGFGNKWYQPAIAHSQLYSLTNEIQIKVVTAPFFLATKFEAFKTRGKMDFLASRDFEDIVTLLDGRVEIVKEISELSGSIKQYLVDTFFECNQKKQFHDALPGHFIKYGDLAEHRISLLNNKLAQILKA